MSPEHLEAAVAEALERGLVRRKRLREALETLEEDERRSIVEGAMSGAARMVDAGRVAETKPQGTRAPGPSPRLSESG